jgi:hypothetical protein
LNSGAFEPTTPGWPGRVAVGIVRGDPPQVFLADSAGTLGRLLATRVVATSQASALADQNVADEIDQALRGERWADAISLWMEATGEVVDAYPDEEIVTAEGLGA